MLKLLESGQDKQFFCPELLAKVFSAQNEHDACDEEEYLPGLQVVQDMAPDDVSEFVTLPASHTVHFVGPEMETLT